MHHYLVLPGCVRMSFVEENESKLSTKVNANQRAEMILIRKMITGIYQRFSCEISQLMS